MDRHREKASIFFTKLAYGLWREPRPATVPLSKSLGSPVPQTSLILELPDELILSILSHVSPDPLQHTSHHARFRMVHDLPSDDYHRQRVRFLQLLSMTCKAIRLRLLPWVWERLEFPPPAWSPGGFNLARKLTTLTNVLCADMLLATTVKFMTVYFGVGWSPSLPLVKCLESLPNLHTLEIRWVEHSVTAHLKDALKGVKLPQIKTLIIPPAAHPLLRHCRGVEDVMCVVGCENVRPSKGFLRSLASNRNSEVKRLAIPLVLWPNPSRFVAACPKLTELTVIAHYPHGARLIKHGTVPLNTVTTVHLTMSELVVECKALPDFDTLQITHYPTAGRCLSRRCGKVLCGHQWPYLGRRKWEPALEKQAKDLEVLAADRLKELKTERWEREERKTTLRIIKFWPDHPQSPVKVEEYRV